MAALGRAGRRAALVCAVAVTLVAGPSPAQPGPRPTPEQRRPPDPARKLTYTDKAMGTIVVVTIWSSDEQVAATAAQAVFAEFRRLDEMMTTWLPDSEVSRINAGAGRRAVTVSDETLAVIERAQQVSRASNGLFDITVGAFAGLWKFDQDMDGSLPAPAEVTRRRKLVRWRDVIVNRKARTVKLRRKGQKITLGGIAKGYAVDKGAAVLHAAGLTDFILQAGGDLFVSGNKDTQPWVVGIRDPRGPRDQSFAIAPIQDHAFSTSGDYERGFVKDGVRYHHILDPRTGQPARASRSVTVLAKDAFTADSWSKVLFILGPEQALPLVEKMPDFEAVWIDADNKVWMSSGIEGTLKILSEPTPGP